MFNECLEIRWKTAHFCILNFSFQNHFVWEVILSIRHSVSSPDETPRSSSKILRCASYFQLSSRCFIWWWNTHAWYITLASFRKASWVPFSSHFSAQERLMEPLFSHVGLYSKLPDFNSISGTSKTRDSRQYHYKRHCACWNGNGHKLLLLRKSLPSRKSFWRIIPLLPGAFSSTAKERVILGCRRWSIDCMCFFGFVVGSCDCLLCIQESGVSENGTYTQAI